MTDEELNAASDRWDSIAETDCKHLYAKEREYRGSWRKRGGVGAYMMLARKFDRIDEACGRVDWDIFKVIDADRRPEGILDDIRDLRTYLLLVEEYMTRPDTSSPADAIPAEAFGHSIV